MYTEKIQDLTTRVSSHRPKVLTHKVLCFTFTYNKNTESESSVNHSEDEKITGSVNVSRQVQILPHCVWVVSYAPPKSQCILLVVHSTHRDTHITRYVIEHGYIICTYLIPLVCDVTFKSDGVEKGISDKERDGEYQDDQI